MNKQPAVYLMASGRNGTLYTGVTGDLVQRAWQHRNHIVEGFTQRYRVGQLVWFELHDTFESAIKTREADQEVEARMEGRFDRARQLLLARPMGRYRRRLMQKSLDSRVRGNDGFGATR